MARSRGSPSCGEAVQVEDLGSRRGDEGRMRGRGNLRDLLQKSEILRVARELVVADERPVGGAAEHPELLLVDFLEEGRLVELGRFLHVSKQVFLRDIHHPDLEVLPGLALVHQVGQASPGRFEFLKLGVVHDLVELGGDQSIDLGDPGVDHQLGVLGDRDRPLHDLPDELADDVPGHFALALVPRHAPFFDDRVEQPLLLRRRRFGLADCLAFLVSHASSPFPSSLRVRLLALALRVGHTGFFPKFGQRLGARDDLLQ